MASWRLPGDDRGGFRPGNPALIAHEAAQGTFGKADDVAFVVIPDGGEAVTAETVRLAHALTDALAALRDTARVVAAPASVRRSALDDKRGAVRQAPPSAPRPAGTGDGVRDLDDAATPPVRRRRAPALKG